MRARLIAIVAGAITIVVVCLGMSLPGARAAGRTAALPDLGAVPAFSLVDERGQPFTLETVRGRVWVADFIFTRCAGQCPMMSDAMARLQRAFAGAPQMLLVSFSVDPLHDTPGVLSAYAAHYGARPDRWRFVTGSEDAIVQLAQVGFHLGVSRDGSAVEPITHSVRFTLIDALGRIRGYYEATDQAALQRLEHDAKTLLSGAG